MVGGRLNSSGEVLPVLQAAVQEEEHDYENDEYAADRSASCGCVEFQYVEPTILFLQVFRFLGRRFLVVIMGIAHNQILDVRDEADQEVGEGGSRKNWG